MKNLLIVDDENNFLLSLIDMLKGHKEKFMIITANNGKEGIDVLNSKPIDLVVTDLKMPEMDGFGLLAYISSEKPHIPVIVMTAFGTPEIEDRLLELGVYQYIEKPIDFEVLQEKIVAGLSLGSEGHISGFSIASFLQLLEHEKKSCSLGISSKGRQGVLYFQQGNLINATTGTGEEGLDAALAIICWDHPEIDIQNTCPNRKRLIEEPLGYILIESSRLRDERRSQAIGDNGVDTMELTEDELADDSGMDDERLDDMEDLSFDGLGTLSKLPESNTLAMPDDGGESHDSGIDNSLADAIMAGSDVERLVMLSRDGKILAHRNFDDQQVATSLAFVNVAAGQMRDLVGFNGPQSIVMTKVDGERLIITERAQTIFGLEVGTSVSVGAVASLLEKAIAQTLLLAQQ